MKCIEDEIPFELPEGWEWCRVRDIAAVKGGKRLPKGVGFSPCRTAHAYIRVTDMKNHCINTDDLKYISEEVFLQIKNYTISKDDLSNDILFHPLKPILYRISNLFQTTL